MVTESNRPVKEVAEQLGICRETLVSWLKKVGISSSPRQESTQLKRLKELEIENKALKKVIIEKEETIDVLHLKGGLWPKNPSARVPCGYIPKTIEEKYHFVDKHRCKHSVERLCRELGISRSSYYDSKSKKPSRRALDNQLLLREIVQLHEKYPVYGLDSMYHILRRKHRIGRARVHRLMKSVGIHSRRHKAFKVTTNSNHKYPVSPNLLNRNFKQFEPNKVWVGDITYIRTGEGWLYLATLKDLCTKKIVGYAFSPKIDTKLTLEALEMAVRRENSAKGLLHHTDRGVQYASSEYQAKLTQLGFLSSMSRTGNPYDNAVADY